jgi:hypothetical protein
VQDDVDRVQDRIGLICCRDNGFTERPTQNSAHIEQPGAILPAVDGQVRCQHINVTGQRQGNRGRKHSCRLWRSLKYEEVFIKAYGSVIEARRGIGGWLSFYNDERPHQALGYRTPRAVFAGEACEYVDNTSASLRDAPALPTYSQAQHQEKKVLFVLTSVE